MTQKLSAADRGTVRAAIKANPHWTREFRERHNIPSLASMGKDDYIRTITLLGMSLGDVLSSSERHASKENRKPKNAADAFDTTDNDTPKKDDSAMQQAASEVDNLAMAGAGNDTASQLAALLSKLAAFSVDENRVRQIVDDAMGGALENAGHAPVKIELVQGGIDIGELEGRHHPEFPALLRAASARMADGYVPNAWIAGPAGSGKTYAVSKVAEALDVPFHFNGAISMPHELLGFIDAAGTYHRTAFREAYEHGGCYLFDEVDGSDNMALLALNAALANGRATFPDGAVTRHKDCRVFAAANTWGQGATAEYVGRAKLDAAFLSRFPVRLHWNYDEALERDICGDAAVAEKVQRARLAVHNLGLKIMVTPRETQAAASLVAAGFDHGAALDYTVFAPMTDEQKISVKKQAGL